MENQMIIGGKNKVRSLDDYALGFITVFLFILFGLINTFQYLLILYFMQEEEVDWYTLSFDYIIPKENIIKIL